MRIWALGSAVTVFLLIGSSGCAKRKEIRTVGLGEKAEIGPFVYQAIETRWPMTLEGRTAKDRFFIIHVTIFNSGASDATVPGFQVVDDQGHTYSEEVDGTGVDNWLGLSRKLPTAQTDQGNIIFDVPPKHYSLRVADENDNFMYIDIPLNLTSEEPDSKKVGVP
ncbi:MAG TPA: DUF4352 domain-containing protein [Bryobacteraceae bacterium]|jgi:hypothetical protein